MLKIDIENGEPNSRSSIFFYKKILIIPNKLEFKEY